MKLNSEVLARSSLVIFLVSGIYFLSLGYERAEISKQLKKIQEDIGDLAFNNYRTYASAGRTTQDCTEIVTFLYFKLFNYFQFTEMNEKLREVTGDIAELQTELKTFQSNSKCLAVELETIKTATDKNSPLWEMLALPSVCTQYFYCVTNTFVENGYVYSIRLL